MPVKASDFAVEMREMADAGHILASAPLRRIARIKADPENGDLIVVEERAMLLLKGRQCLLAHLIRRRPEETQNQVSPGGGIECVVGVGCAVLAEPRSWIANLKGCGLRSRASLIMLRIRRTDFPPRYIIMKLAARSPVWRALCDPDQLCGFSRDRWRLHHPRHRARGTERSDLPAGRAISAGACKAISHKIYYGTTMVLRTRPGDFPAGLI